MNYVYRDSGIAMPEGIEGTKLYETAYHFTGDYSGDNTVLLVSPVQIDTNRRKVVAGAVLPLSEAEGAIMDAWEAAQAVAAESARQAAKPLALKYAENAFIAYVQEANTALGISITLADGFLEIAAKVEASEAADVDKLKASMKMRTLWDEVLYQGGAFGDVDWHPEIVA